MCSCLGAVYSSNLGHRGRDPRQRKENKTSGKNGEVSQATLSTHVQNACAQSKRNQDFLVPVCEFQNVKRSVTADQKRLYSGKEIGYTLYVKTEEEAIERFHARGQQPCKFIGTKESVLIRTEFNSHRIGLRHQHGCRPPVTSYECLLHQNNMVSRHYMVRKVYLYMRV